MSSSREFVVRPDQVPCDVRMGRDGRETKAWVLLGNNDEGEYAQISEFPPGYVIPAHWHDCEQFLVVLKGSATVAGELEVTPGTIQYTEAHVPYGPLVAGPEGFTFIAIRPHKNDKGKVVIAADRIEQVKAAQARAMTDR